MNVSLIPAVAYTINRKPQHTRYNDPSDAKMGIDTHISRSYVDAVGVTVMVNAEGEIVGEIKCENCCLDAVDIEERDDDRYLCRKCYLNTVVYA